MVRRCVIRRCLVDAPDKFDFGIGDCDTKVRKAASGCTQQVHYRWNLTRLCSRKNLPNQTHVCCRCAGLEPLAVGSCCLWHRIRIDFRVSMRLIAHTCFAFGLAAHAQATCSGLAGAPPMAKRRPRAGAAAQFQTLQRRDEHVFGLHQAGNGRARTGGACKLGG